MTDKDEEKPSVLKKIFDQVPPIMKGCEKLYHKKTWNRFLASESGCLPFVPEGLRTTVKNLVAKKFPECKRRLEKRQRYEFTLYEKEGRAQAYRVEEALERMIVAANSSDMYNQMPLRGGKESLDLMRLTGKEAVFIELKPWATNNSPLYALIELVKNLEVYREILRNYSVEWGYDLKSLILLAPYEYYKSYGINDDKASLDKTSELLKELHTTFNMPMAMYALDYSPQEFDKYMITLLPDRNGQKADVENTPKVDLLRFDKWQLLANSWK